MKDQPGAVAATIRSLLPSLLPAERAVAAVLLERAAEIVEMSSQQVADLAGASRATVVRTCQSLGYTGYQQLRVLLARDAAAAPAVLPHPQGAAAIVAAVFTQLAARVSDMLALLDADAVERATALIAGARRVVVVGNGVSAPLAQDAAARLTSVGRPAEVLSDAIGQQISARLLSPGDLLLVISGSGTSAVSLRAVAAAAAAGADVVAVTSFGRSPVAQAATVALVVTIPELTFRDEVTLASRLPQALLVEGLVAAVADRLGETTARARALVMDVISANLAE
ncbi:MurR/RpiR family transcriptional regulator [Quadrisphaera oryzae]|uniref:MurR/RpiR family transcriptional regulator n=1 Tax=Quadrisphaera TaxID=317661 RepID=UPI0016443DDD|nr:MurR/RpiR family transcriptional regulator [Quadrisphaera sp. RL12-1S]